MKAFHLKSDSLSENLLLILCLSLSFFVLLHKFSLTRVAPIRIVLFAAVAVLGLHHASEKMGPPVLVVFKPVRGTSVQFQRARKSVAGKTCFNYFVVGSSVLPGIHSI